MNIGLLVLRVDSLTYTVAKALSVAGYDVFVTVATKDQSSELDSRLSKTLATTPRVAIGLSGDTMAPESIDLLIVQGHPHALAPRSNLVPLANRAKSITMISAGDRRNSYRQALSLQWRELRWYGRLLRKVKRVAYKDGFYPGDIFRFVAPRTVVGFDVHSRFLTDQEAFRQIHATDWDIEASRPIRVNFLGSRDPVRRLKILDSVRPLFTDSTPEGPEALTNKAMFWHEFSDASPNALDMTKYLETLTQSDFTLCPPGWYLLTHRPIEALLRGSIPVLHAEELDLYDIELVDGKNCIAVSAERWPMAIDKVSRLSESEIVEMRRRVRGMFDEYLNYEPSARRMLARLGVRPQRAGMKTSQT